MTEHGNEPTGPSSPGTIRDPALEERRAREAAEREAESKASSETKFEERNHELEQERADAVKAVGDLPETADE
jgi:hypothetical protein